MKLSSSIKSAALIAGGLLVIGSAQAESASGRALAFTCAGCHGTNGNSTGQATPSIAGMSATYLEDTMIAYKSGERPSTIMTRIAKGYTDEEITAMSEWFAGQTYVPAKQEFDAAKAEAGAAIHEENCASCHEDGGTVADDDAGFLKGQWATYLHDSFDDFRAGNREIPKKMMKVVEKLSADPANRENLIEYYKSN